MMAICMYKSIYAYTLVIWICENSMIPDKHHKFILLYVDFAGTVMAVDFL